MIVVCVNHAQPENWKLLPRGALSRLTPAGRVSAQAAGHELARLLREKIKDQIRLKRVFSSPAAKCVETAIELCKSLDSHHIVNFAPNQELMLHDQLLAPKGQQVSQATMDALLQAMKEIEATEQGSDRESAYLVCGHADLAAITPNREALPKVERKASDDGMEEWNFECQPTIVVMRCDVGGTWTSAQTLGVLACEAATWLQIK